jgi:hypothetical protein
MPTRKNKAESAELALLDNLSTCTRKTLANGYGAQDDD